MNFHISRQGQTFGPYDLATINTMLTAGQLSPQDLAWSEGMSGWTPLAQLPGVQVPAPLQAPAPVQTVAAQAPTLAPMLAEVSNPQSPSSSPSSSALPSNLSPRLLAWGAGALVLFLVLRPLAHVGLTLLLPVLLGLLLWCWNRPERLGRVFGPSPSKPLVRASLGAALLGCAWLHSATAPARETADRPSLSPATSGVRAGALTTPAQQQGRQAQDVAGEPRREMRSTQTTTPTQSGAANRSFSPGTQQAWQDARKTQKAAQRLIQAQARAKQWVEQRRLNKRAAQMRADEMSLREAQARARKARAQETRLLTREAKRQQREEQAPLQDTKNDASSVWSWREKEGSGSEDSAPATDEDDRFANARQSERNPRLSKRKKSGKRR